MTTPHLTLYIFLTGCDVFALVLLIGLYGARALVYDLATPRDRLLRPTRWALALLAGTSVLLLLGRTQEMSGVSAAQLPAVLPQVLLQTRFGHWWLVRTGALLALAVLQWQPGLPGRRFLTGMGIALIVIARAFTGHGGDQGVSWLLAADALHLVAAGLWLGTLFAVSLYIFPALHQHSPQDRASVFQRLSDWSGYSVGVLLVSGIWVARHEVGSWNALWTTTYGHVLDAKLALFAVMLAIGAHNRYIRRPGLWAAAQSSAGTRGCRSPLLGAHRALAVESILGLAVLALVAVLVHGMPPAAMGMGS